jgi:hypothetical protein
LQRQDLSTDQFAAVILSDKNLNQINELQLRKGITIDVYSTLKIILYPSLIKLVDPSDGAHLIFWYNVIHNNNIIQNLMHIMVNW